MRTNEKAIVVASGGADSTTSLYMAKERYSEVIALNFKLGTKQNEQERKMCQLTCEKLGIERIEIPLDFFSNHFKSSLLTGQQGIEKGAYSKVGASSVLPFRNGIMLAIAAGIAESKGFENIILSNHKNDHFAYPDCTEGFIKAMSKAVASGTTTKVHVLSPFCKIDKSAIMVLGMLSNVDYSLTYSCYEGREKHCSECATCLDRKEAFAIAGMEDPTIYEETK